MEKKLGVHRQMRAAGTSKQSSRIVGRWRQPRRSRRSAPDRRRSAFPRRINRQQPSIAVTALSEAPKQGEKRSPVGHRLHPVLIDDLLHLVGQLIERPRRVGAAGRRRTALLGHLGNTATASRGGGFTRREEELLLAAAGAENILAETTRVEEAKAMQQRVFSCGSYEEALAIMGEYVEIR